MEQGHTRAQLLTKKRREAKRGRKANQDGRKRKSKDGLFELPKFQPATPGYRKDFLHERLQGPSAERGARQWRGRGEGEGAERRRRRRERDGN
jgi:hypothetical protein